MERLRALSPRSADSAWRNVQWRKAYDRTKRLVVLLGPALLLLLVVLVYPISEILSLSFTSKSEALTLSNYARIVSVPLYFQVLRTTFQIAAVVTLLSLLLAYPFAYLLSELPNRKAVILLAMVALPWFTSVLVRSYAWMVLLGRAGIINRTLTGLGIISEPLPLLYNAFGVYIGMVHILLPYMVLSLFSVMKGIDRNLVKAAHSAGASPLRAFLHVYLPLSLPGIASGCLLVFVMASGYYVTPALLGSPQETMMAQLISSQVNDLINWEFGSALASVLLAFSVAILYVYNRYLGLDRLLGAAT